ncbi:PREDICTED: neuropeptide F receptor-like [Priapulus caudatus]|uniref:Neuropeptide F receptor-like n=1 Tax=Priapulus caudatus TaxID=37621 RepID=A0ABM1E347_PRICU|nr:PREDICTED: neuropeptide F receptor-like [Priapulus caudatus]
MSAFPGQIDWLVDPASGIIMPSVNYDLSNISNNSAINFANFSDGQFWNIIQEFDAPRPLPMLAEMFLISAYTILGAFGLVGNLLLVYVIARTPALRTARNLYIANLSVAALTLCAICMPFTLIMLIRLAWPFGTLLCKLVPTFQATNVFVSTFSFSAIALDRYNVIVSSSKSQPRGASGLVKIIVIWVVGFLMSIPWVVYTGIDEVGKKDLGFVMYLKCVELFPLTAKAVCTIAVIIIQYLLPVITVTVAHARIHMFLKYHRRSMCAGTKLSALSQAKKDKERRRSSRTTHVLIAITVVFAVSWLPLNIYNLIADFSPDLLYGSSMLPLAVCHAIAMSSACWNPLLYGWLNNTMRSEIMALFTGCGRAVNARLRGRLPVPSNDPSLVVVGSGGRHAHVVINEKGRTELTTFGSHLAVSPMPTRHADGGAAIAATTHSQRGSNDSDTQIMNTV